MSAVAGLAAVLGAGFSSVMDPSRITGRVVPLRSAEAGDARMGGTLEERVAAVGDLAP